MNGNNKYLLYYLFCALTLLGPGSWASPHYPHTDPSNSGNWEIIESISDEFTNGLNHAKWQVCAKDDVFWAGTFKGRTFDTSFTGGVPGGWQYSPDNVYVSNGMLRITTQYEPDYDWYQPGSDTWTHTTGGVWSKQTIDFGYMEIRCKLAYEKQTGAFWTTGDRDDPSVKSELDVFEAIGKHSAREKKMWSSLHDWDFPTHPNNVWTDTKDLDHTFSDDFHTYAAEWDENSVKIYADGVLIHHVIRDDVESGAYLDGDRITSTRWPLTGGQHIWADSEIFEWWGVPETNNPPSDFEVDYIRVWQKAPPSHWNSYIAEHGLSGVKTNNADNDVLNDWAEYVFGGDPTNSDHIGLQPEFNASTSNYTFFVRNDSTLNAHVLVTTNLQNSIWTTNATVSVIENDGSMKTNSTRIPMIGNELYIKLAVSADEDQTSPVFAELAREDFEAGYPGSWIDGGNDASPDSEHCIGTLGARIRDHGDQARITLGSALDLSSMNELKIEYTALSIGLENGEGYGLQFSSDNGANWTTVRSFIHGTDFINTIREYSEVIITNGDSGITFTPNVKIRFQCNASLNAEWVNLDNIVIYAR